MDPESMCVAACVGAVCHLIADPVLDFHKFRNAISNLVEHHLIWYSRYGALGCVRYIVACVSPYLNQ